MFCKQILRSIKQINECRSVILRSLQQFAKMCVDGPTLATLNVDRILSQLGMRRDAAEAIRSAVERILASPLS